VLSPSTVSDLDEDWAYPTDGYLDRSRPVVAGSVGTNGYLYVGQQSGTGKLIALDAKTGSHVWSSSTSHSWANVAVSQSKVFALDTQTSQLVVFPTSCGTSTCSPIGNSAATAFGLSGSPVVSGNTVFVGDVTSAIAAYPTSCGVNCTPLWTGDGTSYYGRQPAVAGSGRVFVAGVVQEAGTGTFVLGLTAYDASGCGASTCAPRWWASLSDPNSGELTETVAVSNGLVYLPSPSGLYAFRVGGCAASPCHPVWTFTGGTGGFGANAVAISHGVVYIVGSSGAPATSGLFALDAKTGTVMWKAQLPAVNEESNPVVANGVVYVNSNDDSTSSELWAFPTTCADPCSALWHSVVSSTGFSSPPTVVNGMVYDGSGDGRLYAYDLNPPATPTLRRPDPQRLTPDRTLKARHSA
jgi:outer membrane protein assembly factor BamB